MIRKINFNFGEIMSVNEENVWNGGPEPINLTEGTNSLGGLFLKRLKEQGDTIKMVPDENYSLLSNPINF